MPIPEHEATQNLMRYADGKDKLALRISPTKFALVDLKTADVFIIEIKRGRFVAVGE